MDPRHIARILRQPLRPGYVPSPPSISLEEARKLWVPLNQQRRKPQPKKPTKCLPTDAPSNPELQLNLFCRILAAKPKMDMSTRTLFPSPLLTKVGITKAKEVGPVSPSNPRLTGPRAYVSAIQPDLPKGFTPRLLSKFPELQSVNICSNFLEATRQNLVDEICKAHRRAKNSTDKRPICTLKAGGSSIYYLDVSHLPTDPPLPELPDVITGGSGGVHLATLLYKYNFIERWRKEVHK